MITSAQCLSRFGDPRLNEGKHMTLWDVPAHLELGTIPNKLYCNALMVAPLSKAFGNLIAAGFVDQLITWDGCFNIRKKKGGNSASLHSWGVAIDINAAWNGYNKPVTMPRAFADCFITAGFDWGGTWTVKDGMHFQLSKL